jgi:vancomycin aglycone glucosyltransferase
MRALITAMGSRGDVQPALALGCALRAKGHEVVVSAASDFAGWAGELGLPFVSSGQNLQQWLQEHWDDVNGNPLRFLRALKCIGTEMFPTWFDSTLGGAEGADVIISANQFAAQSAAEKFGIPIVGVAYFPTLFRSAYHAPMSHLGPGQALHQCRAGEAAPCAGRFRREALVRRSALSAGLRRRVRAGAAGLAALRCHHDRTLVL